MALPDVAPVVAAEAPPTPYRLT